MRREDTTPWYRQFWPWFIIALPAASVIASFVTLYLAGAPPALVVDDYGRIAMATEQRLERERFAAEIGLRAKIEFIGRADGSEQPVAIVLTQASDARPFPERVRLQLVHPTLASQDREIVLEGSRGEYYGRMERPASRVYVSLTDAAGEWRLTGEMSGRRDRYEFVARSHETQ